MREQLIATVERGTAPVRHAANVVDHLLALIDTSRSGRLEGSLLDLAVAAACDVETARRAVASLDPVDHALSVDIQRVPAEEPWALTWAPVTGIVDFMLDWDLLDLDISVVELSEWLDVSPAITSRALDWMARTPGVTVAREGTGDGTTVQVAIALERCPLIAEAPPTTG